MTAHVHVDTTSPTPPTVDDLLSGNRSGSSVLRNYRHGAMSLRTLVGLLIGLAVVATAAGQSSILPVLVTAAVWSPASVGLGLLLGRAGLLSLGQAGLIAAGAYAGALAVLDGGLPITLLLPVAVAASATVAFVTSPILRLQGLYFVLATLVLTFLAQQLLINFGSVTGGAMGLVGIPVMDIGGRPLTGETEFFILAGGCGILAAGVVGWLLRGQWGRSLDLLHHDEENAAVLGVHVARVKAQAWVLNGALAGLSGGLYALYTRYLAPEQFTLHISLVMLAAVMLGGAHTAAGPFIGLLAVLVLPEWLGFGDSSASVTMALILVVCATVLPDGLASLRSSSAARSVRDA